MDRDGDVSRRPFGLAVGGNETHHSGHDEPHAEDQDKDNERAGGTGDKYVRDPVFLASVLFLVGISGHFPLRQARYGLIGIGTLILIFAVLQLLGLPGPPGGL
ncbi:MAG TPA: hypothetical protein VKG38_13360 [Solirubrobacteraceae bacterium]|nr:hypothetical protein [Solirubrobacteraceae bacterium]